MSDTETEANGLFRDLPIVNRKGLHARASAKFVQCADLFDARISVSKDQNTVGGTSIMGLMMLGAGQGAEITIEAEGWDAKEALEAVADLVEAGFHED